MNRAVPDDEDGVAYPAADLTVTIGSQPTVNVIVTNTTGTAATLWGWIDYNHDGVFETGPSGPGRRGQRQQRCDRDAHFPGGAHRSTGTTYARFRLSTDPAAANPTGAATNGEVEDYVATIVRPSDGEVDHTTKIAHNTGGGPALSNGDISVRRSLPSAI